jgi:hypothetical protein
MDLWHNELGGTTPTEVHMIERLRAIIDWLLARPLVFVFGLLVIIVAYVGARWAGSDFLPPALKLIGIEIGPKVDISGEWKYRCTGDLSFLPYEYEGQKVKAYQHGGTCKIDEKWTNFGVEWTLFGMRRWVNYTSLDGTKHRDSIDPPFIWQTEWGAITGDHALRFTYNINTKDGIITGYGWGTVSPNSGVAEKIDGIFYQLPPHKPLYGTIEFLKMKNPNDVSFDDSP